MQDQLQQMCRALQHRGPDDEGSWCDMEHGGIALGHRRLSIIDLSPLGHQPMTSACGRYVVVYNGEIYNHPALRQELGDHPWRGHSDTETMLACFTRHGVLSTLPRLVGMFAIAVWDRQERLLTLARDRMGEKPLYWGYLPGGDFVFGSELKALRAHAAWNGRIDRNALALYMRHNCVPAPYSIYEGIQKLRPGEWLQVGESGTVRTGFYWSLKDVAVHGVRNPLALSDEDAVQALSEVLGEAVKGQMIADVPLGAFLSGGVDSSLIVAMMARYARRPVRTFTIGFREQGYDEAAFAKAVAAHLGTDHTEIYMSARDALDVVPSLPTMYDEPFADSSQIPTFLVSRIARAHVTVALSGDGGDELFAGYNRYLLARSLWRKMSNVPLSLRKTGARVLLGLSPATLDTLGAKLPHRLRSDNLGDKLHKFARSALPAASQVDMYRSLVSHWSEPEQLVIGAVEPRTWLHAERADFEGLGEIEYMSLMDQLTYLPDDVLVKVDRAAMATSLETRAPLLDHRVVEFAWRIPMHQKMRHRKGKWLMRELLYKHVPTPLIERPKQGFAIPLDSWLRGPLKEWAAELLSPGVLRQQGLFDAVLVQRHWSEHLSGARNWQHMLWDVLMFQAWHRQEYENAPVCAEKPLEKALE